VISGWGGGKLPVARDEKRSLSVPTALLGHAAYQRTCSTVQTPPLDRPASARRGDVSRIPCENFLVAICCLVGRDPSEMLKAPVQWQCFTGRRSSE